MKLRSLAQALSLLVLGGALAASAQTAPYVRTVIVPSNSTATANGTALITALAGLSPAPSFTNRWLIKLEPGIYDVVSTPVVLSPYVDIEGSGVLETTLQGSIEPTALNLNASVVEGASESEIRNLTLACNSKTPKVEACQAMSLNNTTGSRLSQARILVQGTGINNHWGLRVVDSNPILDDVEVEVYGSNSNYGVSYVGASAVNINRSSIVVRGGSNDNLGIVIKDDTLSSLLRHSTVTASGGLRAMAIAYINCYSTAPFALDDVILSADGGSSYNAGIALHPTLVTLLPGSPIFFRGGRIASSGDGISLPTVPLTVSHTEIEAYGNPVFADTVGLYYTRVIGTGSVISFTSSFCAASVNNTGTFLANTCP